MSEPTLSAEPASPRLLAEMREKFERTKTVDLRVGIWTLELGALLATIDAQATEIAALRGALEREKRSEWREGLVAVIDHEGNYLGCMGTMTWAVLAGKEAQG